MSSYSDFYKDLQAAEFLDRWTPEPDKLPEPTFENLRHNIAHRRAAEAELKQIKTALRTLRDAL